MSVVLDIFVTLSFFAQGSYFKELMQKQDFESIKQVLIFSSGFLLFWIAVKVNEYIVYCKNPSCIYYNFFEFILFKMFGFHEKYFRGFIFIEIGAYIVLVLNILWFLKRKKNQVFTFID